MDVLASLGFLGPDLKPATRRHTLNTVHIPGVHPEMAGDMLKVQKEKREAWKVDYAARAKVQCFLCDYASSKGNHLKRHYTGLVTNSILFC